MSKKIIFNKYQKRAADYHWQQVSSNLFRLNAFVLARYQQVVGQIRKNPKAKILDIGCGDGVLLSFIRPGILYGVDADKDSLLAASKRVKAKFFQAKAEKLPFKNIFFDVVIATEIIEHLAKPEMMLKEILRVLKPGGQVIITTPVKPRVGLTDLLHQQEFKPEELKIICRKFFKRTRVMTSHPLWLKKIYTGRQIRLGRFYIEPGRWLINLIVLLTRWDSFTALPGKPTQQLLVAYK